MRNGFVLIPCICLSHADAIEVNAFFHYSYNNCSKDQCLVKLALLGGTRVLYVLPHQRRLYFNNVSSLEDINVPS